MGKLKIESRGAMRESAWTLLINSPGVKNRSSLQKKLFPKLPIRFAKARGIGPEGANENLKETGAFRMLSGRPGKRRLGTVYIPKSFGFGEWRPFLSEFSQTFSHSKRDGSGSAHEDEGGRHDLPQDHGPAKLVGNGTPTG